METAKFYLDKFYTKFYYNYVVWKVEILCWKFYVVWKLCIDKFYDKFYAGNFYENFKFCLCF